MEMTGVPDDTERTNLIAYLRTLSEKPVPLP
jgi:cytochrome c